MNNLVRLFDVVYLKGQKRAYRLVESNHVYVVEKRVNDKLYLRCRQYKDIACTARATLEFNILTLSLHRQNHNHLPLDVSDLQFLKLIKDAVVLPQNMQTSISKIYILILFLILITICHHHLVGI